LKSNASSQSFKKRMKELEKASTRIEAKMAKLKKITANISRRLDGFSKHQGEPR
jgi:Skp family chaperone for outer membrane proteins